MATIGAVTTLSPVGSQNSLTTPPSITTPSCVAGDLLMVAVFFAQATGNTTLYTPAGMTAITIPGTVTNRLGAVYAAVVSNPADFAAGIILKSGNTATRIAAVAWVVHPVGTEFFTIPTINSSGPDWNGATMSSDTFPAGATGDLFVGIEMTNKGASTTLTTHTLAGTGTAIGQARALSAASGSVSDSVTSVWLGGTGTTFNLAQANGQAYTIGIKVNVPSVVIGVPVKLGTGAAAYASNLDGSTARVAPASIRTFYPGFPTIAAMEAVAGATWAHRGDSFTLPDMSEYAYDRAVMRRYGALEFSTHRTSDGVWFGIHDDTLARTSEDVGLTGNITAMTWADVQTHLNTLRSGTHPRPYYLLDDFLAKYTNHVLIVDNKLGTFNTAEFLPKLAAVPNAFTHIVVKIDGSFAVARFQEAKAAGFKVAGFWYSDSYNTTLPARVPYTDYIGMEYIATQAIWDVVVAYGKLTWGHIAQSQAAYNTAITKGAHFVQCGNVQTILPVR